jgi:adenine phosphoribosyltransferase
MGEEASCNAVGAMEAATNAKPAKENGCAPAVTEAAAEAVAAVVAQEEAAPVAAAADPRLQGISDAIRVVPHFPKQGAPCSLLDLHALSG